MSIKRRRTSTSREPLAAALMSVDDRMDTDAAPAAAPAAPVLSYATNPSIVHKIARYASPETKLAFRATSRTFRLLLDPGIFEHVILDGGPEAERLRSADRYLPGQPWHLGEDAAWPLRLPYVRILDLRSPTGPGFARYKAELSGLEMIRGANHLHHPPDPLTEAPFERRVSTMVDTVHLCGPPPGPMYSGSARKHVFNVLFDPHAEHIPPSSVCFPLGAASHLVFVFTPHYCHPPGRRAVARAHNLLCSVLGRILTGLWMCGGAESVTFVGLAELNRRSLGLLPSSSAAEVEEAVRAAFGTVAFQDPMTHAADLTSFLATVKFLSRAAYRASVGERAYALETDVDGPTTPHAAALDHTCYPHILDRVFALAPWDSMLRLRSVSRALKQRADAALFKHIIVLPGSLPYLLFVRGSGGRLPAVSSWDARHNDRLVDDNARPLFAHTRVLDIPTELDAGIACLVCKLLPNLQVVRNLSFKHAQLTSAPAEVHYQPLSFFAWPNFVRFVPSVRAGSTTTRLVINHLYDVACPTASILPSVSSARGEPGEVVLVFSPFAFPTSAPGRPATQFLDDVVAYIISAVCRRRMGREAAKLTIVGVGEMAAAASAESAAEGGAADSGEEVGGGVGGEGTDGGEGGMATPEQASVAARRALLDPAALANGRLADMFLQRAFDERGEVWRVPARGEAADNLRFVSRENYITDDTFWETEVPPLAAMYAAGWAPAR